MRDIRNRGKRSDNTSNTCRAVRIKIALSIWTGDKAACEVAGVDSPQSATWSELAFPVVLILNAPEHNDSPRIRE